jgi:hypothetical protein
MSSCGKRDPDRSGSPIGGIAPGTSDKEPPRGANGSPNNDCGLVRRKDRSARIADL